MYTSFFLKISLIFRERGREKERERNTNVWEKQRLAASHIHPNQGPGPQPKHVPWDWESNWQSFTLWYESNQLSHTSQGYTAVFSWGFFVESKEWKKKIYDFIYLFLERGEGRERGRETSMCDSLLHIPYCGPDQQPRHTPWLEIKSGTLWFTGHHSIHWATPARAIDCYFNPLNFRPFVMHQYTLLPLRTWEWNTPFLLCYVSSRFRTHFTKHSGYHCHSN